MSGEDECRYVSSMSNNVVNPVVTPSAASGALVGPDYKYSAVWTPINMQLGAPSALSRCSCASWHGFAVMPGALQILIMLLVTGRHELQEGIAGILLTT